MGPCSEADDAARQYYLRELDSFRRLTEHREIATARAMDYCAKYKICPPEWLVVEAASLLMKWLRRRETDQARTNGKLYCASSAGIVGR